MKTYCSIIGKSGAGKETVYQIIKEKLEENYRVSIHHFSDPLNEILDLLFVEKSRPNQQWLSTTLREKFGEQIIGDIIFKRAKKDLTDIVCLDGVRRPQDVVMVRHLPQNYLLFITASPEARFDRLKKRADRFGDAEKTWKQFLAEQSAESEMMIDEIGKQADLVIDNSGTLEDLRAQVATFLVHIVRLAS